MRLVQVFHALNLQVSCNDWCLLKKVTSAYLLEKLITPLYLLGMGSTVAADGSDSCFLTQEPPPKKRQTNKRKRPREAEDDEYKEMGATACRSMLRRAKIKFSEAKASTGSPANNWDVSASKSRTRSSS
jgi:hypothetical protein